MLSAGGMCALSFCSRNPLSLLPLSRTGLEPGLEALDGPSAVAFAEATGKTPGVSKNDAANAATVPTSPEVGCTTHAHCNTLPCFTVCAH